MPSPPDTLEAAVSASIHENRIPQSYLDIPSSLKLQFIPGIRSLLGEGHHIIRDDPITKVHDTASLVKKRGDEFRIFMSVSPISRFYNFMLDTLPESYEMDLQHGHKIDYALRTGVCPAFTFQIESDGTSVLSAKAYHSSIRCKTIPHKPTIHGRTRFGRKYGQIENPASLTRETDLYLEATHANNTAHGEKNLVLMLDKLAAHGIAKAGLHAPNLCINGQGKSYKPYAEGQAIVPTTAPARRSIDRFTLAVIQSYALGGPLPINEQQMANYCNYQNRKCGLGEYRN